MERTATKKQAYTLDDLKFDAEMAVNDAIYDKIDRLDFEECDWFYGDMSVDFDAPNGVGYAITVHYEVNDNRIYDRGDYFTPPSVSGCIRVNYHATMRDIDGELVTEFKSKVRA